MIGGGRTTKGFKTNITVCSTAHEALIGTEYLFLLRKGLHAFLRLELSSSDLILVKMEQKRTKNVYIMIE